MPKKLPILLCALISVYSLVVLLTDFSLTGFWADVLFSISLFVLTLIITFKRKMETRWLTITLRSISVCFVFVVYLFLTPFMTIFFADTFKLRSFHFINVENRLFHAYFKPVGAYSGGYGHLLITESPEYFPVLEQPVYYDRTVHHDFSEDTFDGQAVDNTEIIRQIITETCGNK